VNDGTYYAVETSVAEETGRPGYSISLDAEDATSDGGVAFEDLPAVDRTALYAALGYPGPREMARYERARSISATLAYPTDDAEARSELVPDPAYDTLRIAGSAFRIEIGEHHPVTVERIRIGLTEVAPTSDAFATFVYDRAGVDLDDRGLTNEQRDIVETALDEGYDECAPYSGAFAELQGALGGIDSPYGYADYGDEWYAVDLFEAVA